MKKKNQSINKKKLLSLVSKFSHVPILVVGDMMLDRSIFGSVSRISPEAPVPVVHKNHETFTAGGAGNVVYNLNALGALPTLVAIRGADSAGEKILKDFQLRSLNIDGLIADPDVQTIQKIRIIAGQQQIARVDYEDKAPLPQRASQKVLAQVSSLVPENRAVIISDYGKGIVTLPVIQRVLKEAHKRKISVTVDPKVEHFMHYKGVDCITPNQKEAIEGMRALPPKNEKDVYDLGWKIIQKLKCRSLLLTRGEKGMIVYQAKGKMIQIPTQAREVFDVAGAGDTVIAAFTLSRAVGATHEEAAQIANLAAGIVVGKLGTACTSQKELSDFIKAMKV